MYMLLEISERSPVALSVIFESRGGGTVDITLATVFNFIRHWHFDFHATADSIAVELIEA